MAGDWIKMRCDLFTDPKVVRISSALKADTLRTVGGLMSVWCLFDAHSIDGKIDGYTKETLDDHIRWQGFAAAMVAVGWLVETGEGLELPRFEEHNGQSAKRRAQDADRKKGVRKMSASEADKKRTREEKRREDIKEPHTPQAGQKLEGSIALQTYLDQCKQTGKKPIDEKHAVFEYADKIGIPHDFLRLQWLEFKARYTMPGAKRYKAWQTVFLKSVRGNWFKLWYATDGTYALTTTGQQAKAAHREAA